MPLRPEPPYPKGSVTSDKIAPGAVTNDKLATGSVGGANIIPGSIGTPQLAGDLLFDFSCTTNADLASQNVAVVRDQDVEGTPRGSQLLTFAYSASGAELTFTVKYSYKGVIHSVIQAERLPDDLEPVGPYYSFGDADTGQFAAPAEGIAVELSPPEIHENHRFDVERGVLEPKE